MLISFFKTKEKEKGSSIEANIYICMYGKRAGNFNAS